jgi:phosphotransacetylase
MKLLEVLDLKDDQVEKFFAVYNKHTKRILDLREKVLDDAKELQSMIQKGAPDADLVSATASLRNTIKELGQEFDARFESVKPTLKLNQFAKYVVFEARFQDELQKMVMKRLRKQRDD